MGIRLANYALAEVYGKKDIPYKSPVYKSMKIRKTEKSGYILIMLTMAWSEKWGYYLNFILPEKIKYLCLPLQKLMAISVCGLE